MKKLIFCILNVTEDFGMDLDLLARGGTDPRIRIRIRICTKISRNRNTVTHNRRWPDNLDQKQPQS